MEKRLSDVQREAAEHFNGPCLCIAGPGSGKTLVLTERIAYLVREKGIESRHILVVTFTREAAASMKRRSEEQHRIYPSPAFGTFHSVFYNILSKEGRISPEKLISGRKALGLLSLSADECGIKAVQDGFYPALIRTISYYKNTGILDENLYPNDISTDQVRQIIASYQRNTVDRGYMDMDDILLMTKKFFEENPSRLEFWRQRFTYLLVDECQDMAKNQYDILKILSAPSNNIFLVGDDDQSIYGFRGADPSFLMQFEKDYSDVHKVVLDTNYRSRRLIVSSSAKLIASNRNRFEKDLKAAAVSDGQIMVITARDEHEEGRLVAAEIRKLLDAGSDPSQIAVLYRSRRVSECLMMEMSKPVPGKDSTDGFYSGFVVNDLISILRAAEEQVVARDDFFTALTRPERDIAVIGLGNAMVDRRLWLEKMSRTVYATQAKAFVKDLDFIKTLSPVPAIRYIMKKCGYERYIRDYSYKNGMDSVVFMQHAARLMEEAAAYRKIDRFCCDMAEKVKRHTSEKTDPAGGIGFYTFHGSKGLEFDTVFIIGACDGITPSDKADTAEKIEEERRIFYVAMTRAKKRLFVSTAGKYGSHAYYPSPFLKEAFG